LRKSNQGSPGTALKGPGADEKKRTSSHLIGESIGREGGFGRR